MHEYAQYKLRKILLVSTVMALLFGPNLTLFASGYIQAYIDSYDVKTRTVSYGQTFHIQWHVKLAGSETHTYYFGASVRDPYGQWYDIPYSSFTGQDNYVVNDFRWSPPNYAPEGNYLVRIAVWGGANGGSLQNRLDYLDIPNAFRVTSQAVPNVVLSEITVGRDDYEHGETVSVQPHIYNYGSDQALYVGYSVRDRFGQWWDAPYQMLALRSGDSAVLDLKWKIPSVAPDGQYDVKVALWEGVDTRTEPDTLLSQLDYREVSNAFQVVNTQSSSSDIPPMAVDERPVDVDTEGGGCLVATAAYGTELAPQVQMLRELRDGEVLGTKSGAAFMTVFNQFYYLLSPTVADWERQNTFFKWLVGAAITPMLSTLSILAYVDVDSEYDLLGYGIGIVLLNIGMYILAPAFLIMKLKRPKF